MKLLSLFVGILLAQSAANADLIQNVTNDENEILVADFTGRTLYTFDNDTATTSACEGKCSEVWPPYLLLISETQTLTPPLGFIVRPNGSNQLTYNGKPVYQYAYDRKAGDDKGDGIGGVWHYIEIE